MRSSEIFSHLVVSYPIVVLSDKILEKFRKSKLSERQGVFLVLALLKSALNIVPVVGVLIDIYGKSQSRDGNEVNSLRTSQKILRTNPNFPPNKLARKVARKVASKVAKKTGKKGQSGPNPPKQNPSKKQKRVDQTLQPASVPRQTRSHTRNSSSLSSLI